MLFRALVSSFVMALAMPAMAGEYSQVSFDQIKAKCREYNANDQMRPVPAQIVCSELIYEWRLGKPGAATLPNVRNVGAGVTVKRMQVPNAFFVYETSPTEVQCLNLVKVEKKIDNVLVDVQCRDLVNIADLGDFCEPHVRRRAAEDPSIVRERVTGETRKVCPN